MKSLAGFLAAICALAQSDIKFEVASVKPTPSGSGPTFIRILPGGRLEVTNQSLKGMIGFASRKQPFEIVGGPAWADAARYDINAKPESAPKEGELPLMVRALLADRFQLTVHQETREMPIYALVLARKDGKLGPNLVESKEGNCTAPEPGRPPAPRAPGEPPPRNCGLMSFGLSRLTAVSVPLADFAGMSLSRTLGRKVIDKTGLNGKFDISLEFAFDQSIQLSRQPDSPAPETSASSIFTAIQDQLGLKLEAQKGPVEVLVIDRAGKPVEND